jgi:hypothetical protein
LKYTELTSFLSEIILVYVMRSNVTGSLSLERFNVGIAADKFREDSVSMVPSKH